MEEKEFTVHGHKMTVSKIYGPKEENPFGICFELKIIDLETTGNLFVKTKKGQIEMFEKTDQRVAESMFSEIVSGIDFASGGTSKILQLKV